MPKCISTHPWMVVSLLMAVAQPACTEAAKEIIENCQAAGLYDIASVYAERFNCDEGGECVDDDFSTNILIRRDETDTDESDGTDYTFCETPETGVLCFQEPDGQLSWSGTGTLCGTVFAWMATAPGSYTESGIWQFANNGDTFTKTSDYRYTNQGGGGRCTGTGSRVGTPPEPASIGGCQ